MHLYSHPIMVTGFDFRFYIWVFCVPFKCLLWVQMVFIICLLISLCVLFMNDSYLCCMFVFTSEVSHFAFFLFLVVAFSFSSREVPLAFLVKLFIDGDGFFQLLLICRALISLPNLNRSPTVQNILGCRFFSFITVSLVFHSLLVYRVYAEKSAGSIMGVPCILFVAFPLLLLGASPVTQRIKNLLAMPGPDSWVVKIPWRRKRQLTAIFLPVKSHGQRSLMSYSPWGLKDMTE